MAGPVATALCAELIVVLVIIMGAMTYVNYSALLEAILRWSGN